MSIVTYPEGGSFPPPANRLTFSLPRLPKKLAKEKQFAMYIYVYIFRSSNFSVVFCIYSILYHLTSISSSLLWNTEISISFPSCQHLSPTSKYLGPLVCLHELDPWSTWCTVTWVYLSTNRSSVTLTYNLPDAFSWASSARTLLRTARTLAMRSYPGVTAPYCRGDISSTSWYKPSRYSWVRRKIVRADIMKIRHMQKLSMFLY